MIGSRFISRSSSSLVRYVPLTASDIEWPMKRYVWISSSVGVFSRRARSTARIAASRTAMTFWPSTASSGMSYECARVEISTTALARSSAVPMP
jgi:hypothetical protein